MDANSSMAGLRVLRHVLDMGLKEGVHALSRATPYLTYEEDQKALDLIRAHITKYGALPHPDTLLNKAAIFLPQPMEPFDHDFDVLKHRFVEDAMRSASDEASEHTAQGDAVGALTKMIGRLLPLTHEHGGLTLTDLRKIKDNALAFYAQQLAGAAPEGQKLGYPTLDAQGTLEDGDMIGVVGRPGAGKTWIMLQMAASFWAEYQEPILFVTQEMSARQLEKRALPLFAGVDPTPMYMGTALQYEVHGLTQEQYVTRLNEAAAMLAGSDVPFLLYDSKMAGTVADIEAIAAMHGIRNVFIDGAYMLRHPDPRLGRYARVPENLDLMKYYCQRTGARIFSSWQFKRNAGKYDASGETPDLDDIGYSHAIGEYMSVILGMLENPKSLTQINKKHITIMKGRGGQTGGFDIHWDFVKMNFKEIVAEETEADLTYL